MPLRAEVVVSLFPWRGGLGGKQARKEGCLGREGRGRGKRLTEAEEAPRADVGQGEEAGLARVVLVVVRVAAGAEDGAQAAAVAGAVTGARPLGAGGLVVVRR